MPTEDITAFALVQYKALVAAYDHFMELRSQIIMEFKDCQDMADQIRTALKSFSDDALGTVIALQVPVPVPAPPINFQPLYDVLSETHAAILDAQIKLTSTKLAPAPSVQFSPVESINTALASPSAPIVLDGPVLPPA